MSVSQRRSTVHTDDLSGYLGFQCDVVCADGIRLHAERSCCRPSFPFLSYASPILLITCMRHFLGG